MHGTSPTTEVPHFLRRRHENNATRLIVIWASILLLAIWFWNNFNAFIADNDAIIRLVLAGCFSLAVLFRMEQAPIKPLKLSTGVIVTLAIVGLLMSVGGTIFNVHQFKWLGVILILCACLQWALPERWSRDILLALFVLYWAHPLPAQVFGPLELLMQRLSVKGSEWLLQFMNVRVWADEMVLRTGFRAFGVPESCSGMRTAVTVLLCGFGTGLLLRFKWFEILAFAAVGLAQVLVANILRISFMVVISSDKAADWGDKFLHDTLGVLLLITIVVIQIEAVLWGMFQEKRRKARELASETRMAPLVFFKLPRLVFHWIVAVASALIITGAIAIIAYKSRPYHRAALIGYVCDRLVRSGPGNYDNAEKAAAEAVRLIPNDMEMRTKWIEVLLLRKKFDKVLAELANMRDNEHSAFRTVLKSRALLGMGRPDEAIALLNTLPYGADRMPAVAMVRAECAASRDDMNNVTKRAATVSTSMTDVDKARSLFPYLAARQQWNAIADSYSDAPHKSLTNALLDVHAHMELGDLAVAQRIAESALKKWPDAPDLLTYFATLKRASSDREWKEVFSDKKVLRNLVLAARVPSTVDRVRALFPYLAVHQQWETIARCHSDAPHINITNAFIEVRANLEVNNVSGAGAVLRDIMERWPDDSRVPGYIAMLARVSTSGEWAKLFEHSLKSSIIRLTPDDLAACIDNSFLMSRPDLGWLAYKRLEVIAPAHPALYLIPANFGDVWFMFRKNQVGISSSHEQQTGSIAAGEDDKINLAGFYFKRLAWPRAPLARELTGDNVRTFRAEALQKCLTSFKEKEKNGKLSPPMLRMYSTALRLSGKFAEAREKMDAFESACAGDREWQHFVGVINTKLNEGDITGAGETLKVALKRWPNDPSLFEQLVSLAKTTQVSEWEQIFEDKLKSNIETLSADDLAVCAETGFRLTRPDLAWLAYNQLRRIDPAHPAANLLPAQFGEMWFRFRSSLLGIQMSGLDDAVDIGTLYIQARLWPEAPLAHELTGADFIETKKKYLQKCLAELERREGAGETSFQMRMMRLTVLPLLGRYASAHTELHALQKDFPYEREELLLKDARIFEQEGNWQKVYEIIREYNLLVYQTRLDGTLLQINALMHLRLGLYALAVAYKAMETFPETPQVYETIASIWTALDYPEEALFFLDKARRNTSLLAARLLERTERYAMAETVLRSHGQAPQRSPQVQAVLVPRAELIIEGQFEKGFANEKMSPEDAAGPQSGGQTGDSPFVSAITQLKSEWLRKRGEEGTSDPIRWVAAGRDDMEKGTALNELATLLIQDGRRDEALGIVEHALDDLPDSAILWRMRIALTDGNRKVVEDAIGKCPSDPEIWLAYLVVRTREGKARDWAIAEIRKAVTARQFSVGTIVRAGDFMRRSDALDAACIAARYAMENGGGFMPAYALGLRCALAKKDMKWALACSKEAADIAVDPWPFYEVFATIKAGSMAADETTVSVLKKLVARYPEDAVWARKLGAAYLGIGNAKEAMKVYDGLIQLHPKDVGIHDLLMAAEAAHESGEGGKAVDIMENAYALFPTNRVVLNNLVYDLAFDPGTLARARALLPRLLELWGEESPMVMDTAALVYRQCDEPDEAMKYLRKAAELVRKSDMRTFALNPWTVDIDVYLGKYDGKMDVGLTETERRLRQASRARLVPLARELAGAIDKKKRALKDGQGK